MHDLLLVLPGHEYFVGQESFGSSSSEGEVFERFATWGGSWSTARKGASTWLVASVMMVLIRNWYIDAAIFPCT